MSSKPKVIIISGPTCTGKSTLAKAIAEQMEATLLSQDEILSELIPDSDRNVHHRRLSYEEMFERAKAAHERGEDLVLEGTFSRPEYRTGVALTFFDSDVLVFELRVPVGVALERFKERIGHPAIDHTEEIVCARNVDYPFSNEPINLNGTLPTSALLGMAMSHIRSGAKTDIPLWRSRSIHHSGLERFMEFGFQRF